MRLDEITEVSLSVGEIVTLLQKYCETELNVLQKQIVDIKFTYKEGELCGCTIKCLNTSRDRLLKI